MYSPSYISARVSFRVLLDLAKLRYAVVFSGNSLGNQLSHFRW